MSGPGVLQLLATTYAVQGIGYIASALLQTEKHYDLFGALSFATNILYMRAHYEPLTYRQTLLAGAVLLWCGRLGVYLFRRVLRDGKDGRFDGVRDNPAMLAVFWGIQGVWVLITACPAYLGLAEVGPAREHPLTAVDVFGAVVYVSGLLFEWVADYQKWSFQQSSPDNRHKFISHGLWSVSRHPNYFGEITLWIGMAILSYSGIDPMYRYAAFISPAFTAYLLTRMSGVPMLERASMKKFGKDPAYIEYCHRTPILTPFVGKAGLWPMGRRAAANKTKSS
eukprot:Clim_evm34s210 gene=Clim_evmTU34s210